MSAELKSRLLSFAWRIAIAAIIGALAMAVNILPSLNLNTAITAVIILVLNEVTKFLNDKYQFGSKVWGAIKN